MTKQTQKSKIKSQKYKTSVESPKKKTSTPRKTQSEPRTMDELIAQVGDVGLGLKRGETSEGVVVSASAREVLIDIGKKSFGIIANWELEQVKDYAATLKVGDKVVAQVINPENDMGYVTLSLRKTSNERRWGLLTEKKDKGEDIEVLGLESAKGGLLVEWQSLRGFIPATQLDSSFSANPANLIGRRIQVKVLEIDPTINRLVLSQKASTLGISPMVLKSKLEKIKPDQTLKGVVSGIAPFGLFVDVDGLEGLVHISEIAWEKVESPSQFFKVGEKVDVVVLDVNLEEGKLNLSIKRLTPDPWKNITDRYSPDTTITGTVVRLAPYGVFVQLEMGVEGLIHISKIPSGSEPKVGEKIECIVENVDPTKRKISLTLVPHEKPVGYR
ncbi:30S ribosomal protein S1 [Candidatus Gottesmanbacteria bacterium]|nr:30S ribosomal protein S1 [Candidatus Gottesmanbacteria bacterium]